MKKILTTAILLGLTATAVNATTLNLRHEYIDSEGDFKGHHRDRLAISHGFANGIGLSAEVKWGYGEDKYDGFDYSKLKSLGHETKVSYNYKLSDSFTLQPAYAVDAGDSATTHKFDLRGTQKINSDWNVALRYRYGYKNNAKDDGSSHYNQLNLTSGYNTGNFSFGIDIEGKFDHSGSGYKEDRNYLNLVNFSGEYKGFSHGWRPFGEIGMVAQNTDNSIKGRDSYEPRYRVGVKYSF